MEINIIDKILIFTFRRFARKIYKIGVKRGYNWREELH